MRIEKNTIQTLLYLARRHFGPDAPVRLFGSRLDDHRKGGDIDLHIIAPESTFKDEVNFLVDAEELLDEKIDIRVQRDSILLIDEVALKKGVLVNKQEFQPSPSPF